MKFVENTLLKAGGYFTLVVMGFAIAFLIAFAWALLCMLIILAFGG